MISEKQLYEICEFINNERVLTISVASDGDVWSASCFYQFQQEQMAIYLLSDINSRHAKLMLKTPKVSGTIVSSANSVLSAKGMQYQAKITHLTEDGEKVARKIYYERYPIGRAIASKIWKLELIEIKLTQQIMGIKKSLHWVIDSAQEFSKL